jgi:hypothetical protein
MRTLGVCLWTSFCLALSTSATGQEQDLDRIRAAAAASPFRVWNDSSGKYQTIAKYIGHDETGVTILKQNDLVLFIPMSRLSEEDQVYLSKMTKGKTISARATGAVLPETTSPSAILSKDEIKEAEPAPITRVEMTLRQQDRIAELGLTRPLRKLEYSRVNESLDQLKDRWPISPSSTLIRAIVECAQSGNTNIGRKSFQLLLATDPSSHFELFKQATVRSEFELRMLGYQGLVAINDDASLATLMACFDSEDVLYVGKQLIEFGSRTEPLLHQRLNSQSMEHVLVACSILGQIGTELSLEPLSELVRSSTKLSIRMQAKSAIAAIQSRISATDAMVSNPNVKD